MSCPAFLGASSYLTLSSSESQVYRYLCHSLADQAESFLKFKFKF